MRAHSCVALFGIVTMLSIASSSRLVPTVASARLDPQPEPLFHVVSSVKPRLKLRKRLCAFGSDIFAGCSYGGLAMLHMPGHSPMSH